MSRSRVVFARSAEKHGYTIDDVAYAIEHTIRRKEIRRGDTRYVKLTGEHHGDALVPSLEVMMKIVPDGVVVFHVNAEQGVFWNRD